MDYASFIKKLELPPGFTAPRRLIHEDIVARAITRSDLHDDVRGINASIALIRKTRGGAWPTEPVTEEHNFVDLVWHELEFREGTSFAYAVYDSGGGYIGCCYLYPLGGRTKLREELLKYDVDVSWWVTPDAYGRGYYEKLYAALRHWLAEEFPFGEIYYSNATMPGGEDAD
jgi:GNAT acetyltransferase-like protein